MAGAANYRAPTFTDKVYKDECIFCFHNPESVGGLFVCMSTFYGLCQRHIHVYRSNYGQKNYNVFLHINRIRILKNQATSVNPPQQKITRLAIGMEGGFRPTNESDYEINDNFAICIFPGPKEYPLDDNSIDSNLKLAVDGVIAAEGANRLQELESLASSWDGSLRVETKHKDLKQVDNPPKIQSNGWICQVEGCGLQDNLWLNLSDGSILCGRRYHDGSGGNNHAVEYYQKKRYPLAVKLGTITASEADVYSYDEDDMVIDPYLDQHLAHFGINRTALTKSDKSMLELELDLNLKHEFSLIEESGSVLQPIFGPGLTGIQNLGSSCYINSSVQALLMSPAIQDLYTGEKANKIFLGFGVNPNEDLRLQFAKLFSGLASGDYSTDKDEVRPNAQSRLAVDVGIRPIVFRSLIGRGHPEFSTKRQQDAEEFIRYLFGKLEDVSQKNGDPDPVKSFRFLIEERTQCLTSKQVKYRKFEDVILSLPIPLDAAINKDAVSMFEAQKKEADSKGQKLTSDKIIYPDVTLQECLKAWADDHIINDYLSPITKHRGVAIRHSRIASFPDFLLVQTQRFGLKPDWTPYKLEVTLNVPDMLDLNQLKSLGVQPGEVQMAADDTSTRTQPNIDREVVSRLMEMGFSAVACEKAVVLTENKGFDAACNWIMEHMSDSDFESPCDTSSIDTSTADPALIMQLTSLGFTEPQATVALNKHQNDVPRAAEWLFENPDAADELVIRLISRNEATNAAEDRVTNGSSKYQLVGFISHMGTSVHCGHYVTHLLKDRKWIIFNDEKVAISEKPPRGFGYIYLFQRL